MAKPLAKHQARVEIKKDGTIAIETGDMGKGGVEHKAADDFIDFLAKNLGVVPEIVSLKPGVEHHHHHDHDHTHEGGGHHHHS